MLSNIFCEAALFSRSYDGLPDDDGIQPSSWPNRNHATQ